MQRFYIYAHRGLARQRISVWIYEYRLNIEYQQTLLVRYQSKIDRKRKALKSVAQPQFYPTPFSFPQLELFELNEAEWHRVWLRPPYVHSQIQEPLVKQLSLLGLDILIWLILYRVATSAGPLHNIPIN